MAPGKLEGSNTPCPSSNDDPLGIGSPLAHRPHSTVAPPFHSFWSFSLLFLRLILVILVIVVLLLLLVILMIGSVLDRNQSIRRVPLTRP